MDRTEMDTDGVRRERGTCSKQFGYKILKTVSLIALWISSGLFNSITGTTLVDFQEKLGMSFDQIGIIMMFRSALVILGSIVASAIRDKGGVSSELIIAVMAAICSLVEFLKNWSPSTAFFGLMNAVEGVSQGCMNTIGNAILLALWGSKASAPVHAFHFGYGFGAFFGPLLAKDFLSVRCPGTSANETTGGLGNTSFTKQDGTGICVNATKDHPVILVPGRLEIPLSIVGSLLLILSCIFFTYYFLEKCFKRFTQTFIRKEQVDMSPDSKDQPAKQLQQQPLNFFLPFAILLFFLYFFINSYEGVIYSFLFTFVFESDIGFDKPEAAYLLSVYWACYTCSRFSASVIAHFVSVKIMIFVEMIGNLGALVGLLLLGFKLKTAMWAFVCLMGIFVAPIWPSGIAWADRYVTMKAYVVSVTDVGAGIGGALCMWLAGYFVGLGVSRSYLYVAISGSVVALLLLVMMQIIGYIHGDRHKKNASI